MPKVSKITINFELLKVSKMKKLLKVRKMTNIKIFISPVIEKLETFKFGQQVNLIQRVLLGTLPQEVVMSLAHNYVTLSNFFISSYKGTTVIKFGQQKQFLHLIGHFSIMSSNITFWSREMNLYISSYTEALFIHRSV